MIIIYSLLSLLTRTIPLREQEQANKPTSRYIGYTLVTNVLCRCGLACVLYARQYVRYGKNSQTQAQTTEFSDERKHIHMQYLTVRILKTFLGG